MTSLLLSSLLFAAPAAALTTEEIHFTCSCTHLLYDDGSESTDGTAWTADTIAHEMGHNFGMCHDEGEAATAVEARDALTALVLDEGEVDDGDDDDGSGPEYSWIVDFRVRGENDAQTQALQAATTLVDYALDTLDGAEAASWVKPCPSHVVRRSGVRFQAEGLDRAALVHSLPDAIVEVVVSEDGESLSLSWWDRTEEIFSMDVVGRCEG
ncbi:MAG: hypothetical protein H6742_16820 [Alphaproteobacteria bacterium]|nr:hypothetical protein [Alphaproteobacteria bacterium]